MTVVCALVSLALLGCGGLSSPSTPTISVDASAVSAAVAPYIGTDTPGLSVAVGYHGRIIFAQGYGKADIATASAMTAQTRLGIGSIVKQMTAEAILTLARDKLLALDDPANVLLPKYTFGNRMTLRQLSTMSGGLQGAAEDPIGDETFGIVGATTGRSTVAQVYAKLNANPPIRPPGTQWDYANIDYWLLGRTIEAATHATYAAAMQARVFAPLGMTTAYIRGTQPDVNLATGYSRFSDGTFHTCPELNFATSDSAGMGVMTASDVVNWDEGVRAQRLVPGALGAALFASNGLPLPASAGPPGDSYAMGWNVRNDPVFGTGVFDHQGNTNVFASVNVLFPDGSDVVLLGNAQYGPYALDRYTIAYKVHNAMVGVPALKVFTITSHENVTACQNE